MNKTISIISLLFGVIALGLAFTPIGQIAYLPALVGVFGGLYTFMKNKKNTLAKLATVIALISIAIITVNSFSGNTTTTKNDQILEQKENASKKEAVKDLEELDGLE